MFTFFSFFYSWRDGKGISFGSPSPARNIILCNNFLCRILIIQNHNNDS